MKRWWMPLLFVLFSAAGAAAATAPFDEIITQGETLDFDLSWIRLSGGSARMTIGLLPGDPTKIRMTWIAKSSSSFAFIFKMRDVIESIVDRVDFSTLRYEKHLNERGRTKDDTTVIDERRHIAIRRRPNRDTEEIIVPKPVFDPLSVVYHLRALDLQPGMTQRFTVFADGKIYTLEAEVTGRQTLTTEAGRFNTVVVEPKMLAGGLFRDEGSLTIWYSDDPKHIPVRIRSDLKVGSITATLRAVSDGVSDPEPPRSR